MKVTVIPEDLSTNSLGRAYLLAEILDGAHEVEIVGTRFGEAVWAPADTDRFEFRSVPGGKWPRYGAALAELARMAQGDVLYAMKPKASSFGAGLLARRSTGSPLILDIDDDELAMKDVSLLRRPRELAWDVLHPNGPVATRLMAALIPRADAVTVASRGLQTRYGGTWIPHAKDTARVRPRPEQRETARESLGLADERVVMFVGTPRPWKGLEDAAEAVARMRRPAVLTVIGPRADDPAVAGLRHNPAVRLYPPSPLDRLPFLLQAADVVVVPQRDQPEARVQLPSKLLDGMAVGKPVVATAVSDIPFILGEDRGVVVPPGDPGALADALDLLFDDPERAASLGARARSWCEEHASYRAVRSRLVPLLESLVEQA